MQVFKFFILILIFLTSSWIGILISKRYTNRVKELKEIKNALNVLETKIKFTYEPLGEIFKEIGKNMTDNIAHIFTYASNKLKNTSAEEAWKYGIENSTFNLTKEDKNILKELGKLLRQNRCRRTS